jgi:hypothetical protein
MTRFDARLAQPWLALKIGYGLIPILAGADKFLNLLTFWPRYVSPAVAASLPVGAQQLMYLVGIVEIAVGLMVLTRWTVLGSYVAAVWLLCIAANLVLAGFYDVAVRDAAMAVGAFALARLTEVRADAASPAEVGAAPVHRAA